MKNVMTLILAQLLFIGAANAAPKTCNIAIFNDQMVPISIASGLVDLSTSEPLELSLKEGFQFSVKKIEVVGVGSFVQLDISKGDVSTTALYDLKASHPFHILKIGNEKAQAQCFFEP